MDEEVSMDSTEEAERFLGWAYNVSLVYLQREVFLMIHALKREQDQEMLSLREVSSFHPLRKGSSSVAQVQNPR